MHRLEQHHSSTSNNSPANIARQWVAIRIYSWKSTSRKLISVCSFELLFWRVFFRAKYKNTENLLVVISQISQTWVVCHHYMQLRQFLQAVIMVKISTSLLKHQVRYFHRRVSKIMIISHATLTCVSSSATVRILGNHRSKSSSFFLPILSLLHAISFETCSVSF